MPAHVNPQDTAPLPEITGFRLLRLISRGGMSMVYLGEQLALSREVAIKVMLPQALADEVSRRRFENEVRTIARLEHPNVVRIHELGRTRDGLPYYTMPYLARGHLGQRRFVDELGQPDEARVREIAHALLAALEYAHSRGVVHRDVKAENVLFDDAERPLLADFGIALRRGFGPRVTAAGLAVGSTAYMAPEQARGEDVDGRADLYSLGVVIWEMLTGHLPYQAGDALSMAVMHAQDPIPKPPLHLRHWQRFMQRALAKSPANRFQNAAEMREAMDRVRPQAHRLWWLKTRAATGALFRRLPPRRLAAIAAVLVAAVGIGFALTRDRGEAELFRAGAAPEAPAATADDPIEAMLEPLPEAPLQTTLQRAREQLAQRRLTSPDGDNAYASALEAWHMDGTSPEVQQLVSELSDVLGEEVIRNLAEGNDARALDYHARALQLARQTATLDSPSQRRLREREVQTLRARMEHAVERVDRERADQTAKLAGQLALPPDFASRLTAQAKRVPKKGQPLPGDRSRGVVRDGGDGPIVMARRPVTRSDYAKFVNATARPSSLCRERASLLRVFAPKDWKSPGFQQDDTEPVVCVSMADAEAYARWYSQQTGHQYRVPTSDESRDVEPEIGDRAVSLWLRDCGPSCVQRLATGRSWRKAQGQRPLPADRGYDDVGFRLVREL